MAKIELGGRDHHHFMFHVDEAFPFVTLEVPATMEQFLEVSVG